MTKIIFMGTPAFSVPVLEQVANEYEVIAVVTQPDRAVGRKRVLTPPPVKEAAVARGIPVYQPEKLRSSSELDELIGLGADLIVTAAYGQILPNALLDAPKHGCINVHASLLPEYRGGAPVHYAILDGKTETGVTIMYMVEQLDAGDMLARRSIPITDEDNVGTMFEKLSAVGASLLMDTLPDLLAGKLMPEPQDASLVTFAPNIKREQEKIDWTRDGRVIFNQIRGLSPWPVAYTTLAGNPFKIWQAHIEESEQQAPAGQVVRTTKHDFAIATGDKTIIVPEIVQPAGKQKMAVANYMAGAGQHLNLETRFGDI
ncbi:methionyl-tRNA formyltransferase [Paenilisteria rocourtiae]|uniref:Methionyl-tRNA formyltransferase n=1 Tax=Listeria rocourtiae TaxID=647910 RepID=A0A4R6ZSR7_9LIST|nr:methionyl-tRNA formyltransferase [Listeria rocourtiae]EUJ49321.1 methionyl-tRNA formyltransferase [Listeria rocourtiae FSL F6-920]MBC1603516.1 methionyl-tRNA formyltransferase [Listeria rocourtiae]TDR55199.1 methionyl-tRNA formyltransferase [Listeria rocourtiae]